MRGVAEQLHAGPGAEGVLQFGHHPADVLDRGTEGQGQQPDGAGERRCHAHEQP